MGSKRSDKHLLFILYIKLYIFTITVIIKMLFFLLFHNGGFIGWGAEYTDISTLKTCTQPVKTHTLCSRTQEPSHVLFLFELIPVMLHPHTWQVLPDLTQQPSAHNPQVHWLTILATYGTHSKVPSLTASTLLPWLGRWATTPRQFWQGKDRGGIF